MRNLAITAALLALLGMTAAGCNPKKAMDDAKKKAEAAAKKAKKKAESEAKKAAKGAAKGAVEGAKDAVTGDGEKKDEEEKKDE